jgi:hypothetical protein
VRAGRSAALALLAVPPLSGQVGASRLSSQSGSMLRPPENQLHWPPRRDELDDMSDKHSEWSALARTAEITAAANRTGRWASLWQNAIGNAWAHEASQLHIRTNGSALHAVVADLHR